MRLGGPPLGPGGEDITWPDQVAPRGRKASSTRGIKPQTSNVKPDETAASKGITAHPRLAKFLRPLQPQPRRPPTETSAEDSLIRQTGDRLSQKEAAKSAPRGSLKRAKVAAALANGRMRDRVREAAAEAGAAHDSSTTTSSSEFEPSLAHKSRLRVKPSGRRVTGKQQLSEAVKAAKGTRPRRSKPPSGRQPPWRVAINGSDSGVRC